MWQPLAPLDLYLLDKVFDPLSVKINNRFGIGNFTLSKWMLTLGNGIMFGALFAMAITRNKELDSFFVIASAVFMLWTFRAFRTAVRLEERYHASASDALPVNLRDGSAKEVENRRFFLFLVLVTVANESIMTMIDFTHLITKHSPESLYLRASWLWTLVGFYFLGCTPRMRRRDERKAVAKVPLSAAPAEP